MNSTSSKLRDIWNYADSLGYRVEVGGYVTTTGNYIITVEGHEGEASVRHDCDTEWQSTTFHSHPRWDQPIETRKHNAKDFPTLPSGPDVAQLLTCNDPSGQSTVPRQEVIIGEFGAISIEPNQAMVDRYQDLNNEWREYYSECVAQYVKQLQRFYEFGFIGPKSYVRLMNSFQFKDLLELREDAKNNPQLTKDELKSILEVGNDTSFDQDNWEIFADLDGIIGVELQIIDWFVQGI
jgi:hypothetical protein